MTALRDKAALVTGGSRGIGAAIVRRLAEDGANVALTYAGSADRAREVVAGVEGLGRKAVAIRADSADAGQVAGAVESAVETLGGLDILVNNAGVFPHGPVEELTVEEIERTLAIHVGAALVAVKTAVPHMRAGGRIIGTGSNLADHVPWPGLSLYSASKAALNGLTRALARELGPRGITVTLVHPGSTATDMNPPDGPDAAGQLALNPLGEYARPEDIAATVAHLAGEGGRLINGATITIDGGLNA